MQLFSLFSLLFIGLTFSIVTSSATLLKQAFHQKKSIVNQNILQLRPRLKQNFTELKNYIHKCYDQSVRSNVSVNIFENTLEEVMEEFFNHNGNFIETMNVHEITRRVEIFIDNLAHLAESIFKCARDTVKGKDAVKLGLTPMIFYSIDEFEKHVLNNRLQREFEKENATLGFFNHSNKCSLNLRKDEKLPSTWNWKDQGVLSPIYMQANCSCCYVMGTTDALETQYRILNQGNSLHLSVQATLNCMDEGCNGGSIQQPLARMVRHGVPLDSDFPYKSRVTGKCKHFEPVVKPEKYCYHLHSEDKEMKLMVWRNGPAAVAVSAVGDFKVLKDTEWTGDCTGSLNHVVLLVGWTEKYWIIKNTWGETWGEGGYGKIPLGQNKCMINAMLGVPLLKK